MDLGRGLTLLCLASPPPPANIWPLARLETAHEVTVISYSFPTADMAARTLFSEGSEGPSAERHRCREPGPRRIWSGDHAGCLPVRVRRYPRRAVGFRRSPGMVTGPAARSSGWRIVQPEIGHAPYRHFVLNRQQSCRRLEPEPGAVWRRPLRRQQFAPSDGTPPATMSFPVTGMPGGRRARRRSGHRPCSGRSRLRCPA